MSGDVMTGAGPAPGLAASSEAEAAPSESDGAPSRAARVSAWLGANAPDIAIAWLLGTLAVVVVVLQLDGVATGGDAMRKWHFVRQWFHGTSFRHYEWNHHMSRFGIHWVTFLVQAIGGRGVNNYYAPGLIAGGVQVALLYACTRRLAGRFAGVLAAFLLIYFKGEIRAASQLMPEVFSGMYALLATYFFLRITEARREARTRWLVAMSVTLFVAYLAKETNVFFFPGFAVALVIGRDREAGLRGLIREIAILGGILLAGALIETAAYSYFTDHAHRLAVVRMDHSPIDKAGPKTFLELFDRFKKLEEFWKFSFYSFLVTSVTVVVWAKDRRVTSVFAITATYFLILTFCIASFEPFSVWLSFRSRYFDAMASFVELFAALFVVIVGRELLKGHAEKAWARRLQLSPRSTAVAVLALSLIAGGLSYAVAAPRLDKHPFVFNRKVARIAADAYRRNLPIIATKDNRASMIFHMVFVHDKVLAPEGELPLFRDIRRTYRNKWWFARDPDVFDDDALQRLMNEDCVLRVTVKAPGPVSRVQPMDFLPARCDALVPKTAGASPPRAGESGGTETEEPKPEDGAN